MEIHELLNKEFLKFILKKLNELQENVESNTTNIRKIIHEQNENFNREVEIIKKNQILELKSTMKWNRQ